MVGQQESEGERREREEEMGKMATEDAVRVSGVRLNQVGKKGSVEEREGGRKGEGSEVEEEVKEREFEETSSKGAPDIARSAQG